jgi:type IV pilus biogenesis protein PilP
MKPLFALDFRDGAVALLHRTARGWMSVGQTSFESPDLDETLSFLRSTAMSLSPGGVATKLVIPNDQILYTSVKAPGPDAAKRRKQIAAALEGRTPYPVADLVFDWWGKGDEVNVAVISKETLAEAENFAQAHRFNPVAFVAVPDNGIFQGEPWFGHTSVAGEILAAGEKVDRDQDPVHIIGRDSSEAPAMAQKFAAQVVVEAEPVAKPEVEPEPVAASVAAPVAEPDPVVEAVAEALSAEQSSGPTDLATSADVPEPEAAEPEALVPATPVPDLAEPDQTAEPAATPQMDAVAAAPARERPEAARAATIDPADDQEAPMALDVGGEPSDFPEVDEPTPPPGRAAPELQSRAPEDEAQGYSLLRAFTSRRKDPAAPEPAKAEPGFAPQAKKAAPELPPLATPAITSITSITASVIDPQIDLPKERAAAPEASGLAVIGAAGRDAGAPARLTAERPALARPMPAAGAKAAAKPGKGLRSFGAFVTTPNPAGAKKPKVDFSTAASGTPMSANPRVANPARPAGRPIGLGGQPAPQRGKPRFLGLILTCILLVILALVAAWSTFFLASGEDTNTTTSVAALAQDTPAPEDEMLADMQDPADFAEPAPSEDLAADAASDADVQSAIDSATAALTEPGPDPDLPEVIPLEAAPETGLVSEAGAEAVTPAGDGQDEIFLAAIDPPPQASDPSALESPTAQTDALPSPAVPPQPFGTVYQFDADGRIVPTPEGIATPEGVLLVSGKPPVVPTSRPATVEAAFAAARSAATPVAETDAEATAGATAEAATGATPETGAGNPSTTGIDPADSATAEDSFAPAFADPALKDFRPAPRPASLQGATQSGALEDPALAPDTESRFASLRPQKRPAAILALAAPPPAEPVVDQGSIDAAVQTASLVSNGQILPQDISPLVIRVSRIPATRPKGLVRTAAAAAPAAQATTASASASASNNSAAEADSEPEHTGAMPNLPTSASVAKAATVVDAISLSKLTLIGVFGSEGRRYALVRQGNGRIVKVKVGDSLDGGKVAAITTSEVTYKKGSRALTLEMPRT